MSSTEKTTLADNPALTRSHYKHFLKIPTRWMDNDVYGHVNNVVYYSFFDTVINDYLIKQGGLDIHNGAVVGYAVETTCKFHQSLRFPEVIDAGMRVAHLGNSSVKYEIGLFKEGSDQAAATGHFVHVFVDSSTDKPVSMPATIRSALSALQGSAAQAL
ncbi:MAG: acyl-CoA thioesterase [Burkholderiales bacterium]|nr:acyl-CoA thioesterase [Burkholderiales bacterium]